MRDFWCDQIRRASCDQVLTHGKNKSEEGKLKNGQKCLSIAWWKTNSFEVCVTQAGRGGGTLFNGLYREALLEMGTFFKPQVYERVGISLVEV